MFRHRSACAVLLAALLVLPACSGTDGTSADVIARAERITVELAQIVGDVSPGFGSTVRYGCSADPGLAVAETSLSVSPTDSPRDVAVEMARYLESDGFETTFVDGEAGSGDLLLRASDSELTIDVLFSAKATGITATTECLRSE